jgi:hypothetical protein
MFKTRRFRERETQLEKALNPYKMESLWRNHVRDTLRNQAVSDLHDHYDFHLHRINRIKSIIATVLNGNYQPERPIRIRSEKSHGMSRHLVFLNPEDAIVIESVAMFLMPVIQKAQPCDNSYFSRNHKIPKGPESVDDSFAYPWWILWPQFQKRILDFAEHREITVVTDVATYYDTIDFTRLRNYISSLGEFSEIFLDFLFFLFERFVWRPDYLPFPGKGLPQLNLDAPRLVAHAFLFEIDSFLNEVTKGDFVRWLDDIDFGCDSVREAQKILRDMDELLLSRGLHLNSSKTKILSKKEAFEHFQLEENRYLSILQKRIKRRIDEKKHIFLETKLLKKRYHAFSEKEKRGQWAKIEKRYFTLARLCKTPFLEKKAGYFLKHHSALRSSVFYYFIAIGWSQYREDVLCDYIRAANDDESFMGAIDVLITWIPQNIIKYKQRMFSLAQSINIENPVRFFGVLKLIAKFAHASQTEKFIIKYIDLWRTNDWLARQIACLFPLLQSKGIVSTLKNVINSFGLSSAKLVLDNYRLISNNKNIVNKQVKPYIFALKNYNVYSFQKYLISLAILKGDLAVKLVEDVRKTLLNIVKDPIYRYYFRKR